MSKQASRMIFGYWDGRGRAQPLRFLLEYVGANYEEKIYSVQRSEEWAQDKARLGPFPNLPYIIDGDFYLSEHEAEIKYIVKKHPDFLELLGKTPQDEFRVEQAVFFTNDIRQILRDLCFNKNRSEVTRATLEASLPKFKAVLDFRGQNTFLLPYLTIVDFKFQESLLHAMALDSEFYKTHLSSFDSYLHAFYDLPAISKYVRGERYREIECFFPVQFASLSGKEFLSDFNHNFLGLTQSS